MTFYGREDHEWDRLTEAGRALPLERARLRRGTSYTELNTVIGYRSAVARSATAPWQRPRPVRSPFNSIAPDGPEDLFLEVDIESMITTMHSVNATAIPA